MRYANLLLWVLRLQDAGFQLDNDMFPLDFWADMGMARSYTRVREQQAAMTCLFGGQEKEK